MGVEFVTVLELGQNFAIIAQQNYTQNFADGDSFDYVSVVSDDVSTFPKALQMNIYGQNADGEAIVNIIAISFTNNCSVYPVLGDGFSLGWTEFVSLVGRVSLLIETTRLSLTC